MSSEEHHGSARQVFHVRNPVSGRTVVAALRQWLPEMSWSEAKRVLRARRVSVNGAMCLDGGRRLKTGDVVHLFPHARAVQPTQSDVDVLYCDRHVVVVVKPALMTTLRHAEERHWPAARKNLQPTLDEVLPRLLPGSEAHVARERSSSRGDARRTKPRDRRRGRPQRVRAVHRLDRDTSGVMVFARTEDAERSLVRQFKKHSIDRVYVAVVHGHPAEQTIDTHLVRDRGDGYRGSTDRTGEGQRAITHVRPLESIGEYSLVECRLETGRTHQIRIHLSEAGHLLCGDERYRQPRAAPATEDRSGAPRLALHAARLAFDHPITGKRLEFKTPLPADLERFVTRLRREASRAAARRG